MKRICIILAAAVFAAFTSYGAYNPYAPNPFDTMERSSWEYQYLQELTQDGLTGADMSKFSPGYQLTRFEMVPMVEQAILNRRKASGEQQLKIDRLAKAFAADLELGGSSLPRPEPAGQEFNWKKGDML